MTEPGPEARVSDIELLREMLLIPDPVATASELAERTDYERQNINYRLKQLVEDGLVERKKVGARAVVYWVTEDGKQKVVESA